MPAPPPPASQPPAAPPPPGKRSAAQQAASASWQFPLVFAMVGSFLRGAMGGFVADLLVMAGVLAGIALGIFALVRIRRDGTKGVLVPAIVGLALCGLLLVVFVWNFIAYRAGG